MLKTPENYRLTQNMWDEKLKRYMPLQMSMGITKENDSENGIFLVPKDACKYGIYYTVIFSNYGGWEHVSVTVRTEKRCPTWSEMCYIKNLFWDKEDTVMQIHPAESDYVNNHEYCLHLWRPTETIIPTPPSIFVGVK